MAHLKILYEKNNNFNYQGHIFYNLIGFSLYYSLIINLSTSFESLHLTKLSILQVSKY